MDVLKGRRTRARRRERRHIALTKRDEKPAQEHVPGGVEGVVGRRAGVAPSLPGPCSNGALVCALGWMRAITSCCPAIGEPRQRCSGEHQHQQQRGKAMRWRTGAVLAQGDVRRRLGDASRPQGAA